MSNPQESKLYSATLLIRGMEGLSLGRSVFVPARVIEDAGSVETACSIQVRDNALTRVVLYAIVVELVVKHVWEQEHGRTARYTHRIHELFKELSEETQTEIENLYERCRLPYKNWIRDVYQRALHAAALNDTRAAVPEDVASLEEALQWNECAMRNLKYTMKPEGPSVPTGVGWHGDSLVVSSNAVPNFAVELTRWAEQRSSTITSP